MGYTGTSTRAKSEASLQDPDYGLVIMGFTRVKHSGLSYYTPLGLLPQQLDLAELQQSLVALNTNVALPVLDLGGSGNVNSVEFDG